MSQHREDSQRSEGGEALQYLTFTIADEEYGVPILSVQEIRGWSAITPVPKSPGELKGVMNLRGTIIPVLDLRVKFGLVAVAHSPFTVIIVVRIKGAVVGLMVDAVSDVLTIPTADIQTAPDLGLPGQAEHLQGVARTGDKLVLLLDVDRLLGAPEPVAVGASAR